MKKIVVTLVLLAVLIGVAAAVSLTNMVSYTRTANHNATLALTAPPSPLVINAQDISTVKVTTQAAFTGYFHIWIFNVTAPTSVWTTTPTTGFITNLSGMNVNGTGVATPSPDGPNAEFPPVGPFLFKNGSTISYSFCLCDNSIPVIDGTQYKVQVWITDTPAP